MHTSPYWPPNIVRALSGGVNDRSTFATWLDDNLFEGARYGSLRRPGAPIVWINASDIFNKTPFLFTYDTFAALCSDLNQLPVSEAVAASAAFPIVFAPVVIKTYGPHCGYQRPEWLVRALADPAASVRLKAYSEALENYQNINRLKFVKLLDGGLTDNFGVTGLALSRAASQTPYGPLSPRAAVRLRTLLFLVANAGRQDDIAWAETLEGPSLGELMSAVSATAIDSSVRDEFDALKLAVVEWQDALIRWRCTLGASEVRAYRGTLAGWNCRDVRLFVDEVTFRDLDEPLRDQVQQIATRLTLPTDQVDLTIRAGRESLRRNNAFQAALQNIRRLADEPTAGAGASATD
jgi:Patatin-like phospholipase